MEKKKVLLDFEKPIADLEDKIAELERLSREQNMDMSVELKTMRDRAAELKQKIYEDLSPLQILQISRHQYRPTTMDYIKLIFNDFVEIKGDRLYGDDPAIVGGIASFNGQSFMIIGHQKGHDTKENLHRNFGMPQPEGYRKALRMATIAEKFGFPIITFVDTPGAFPGLGGEERGQAEAIARNLRELTFIKVPILSIVTGEGGSGGALGIAIANKVMMLQYSVYSVISPEGCASILWRDASKADIAAKNQRITAPDLLQLGVIDEIIPEPLGGAHNDYELIAKNIATTISAFIKEFNKKTAEQIVEQRYAKFRALGKFVG